MGYSLDLSKCITTSLTDLSFQTWLHWWTFVNFYYFYNSRCLMLPSRDKFPCRDIFLDLQSFHLKGFLNGPTFHIFFFKTLNSGKVNIWYLNFLLDLRVQNTRGGWIVFSRFFKILANSLWTCLDKLFLTQQGAKIQRNYEHTIFMWKTSSPSKVKNHDLQLIGFPHNPLNGLETLQYNNHSYNL